MLVPTPLPPNGNTTSLLKPWQRGIPLQALRDFEDAYKEYNKYSFSPFTAMNKPKLADVISSGQFNIIYTQENIKNISITEGSYCVKKIAKVKSKIECFNTVVAEKMPGDASISGILIKNNQYDLLTEELKNVKRTFVYIWEEDFRLKEAILKADFKKVCSQFKSTAEIIGIYCTKDIRTSPVPQYDIGGLVSITSEGYFVKEADDIATLIRKTNLDFANHYSNYNKGKSWSALSLKGFSNNITFIEKPAEVIKSKKWAKKYEGKTFDLQNTFLMDIFKEPVEKILHGMFPNCEFERIRLMRLSPGGGELLRHSDLQDPDNGTDNGKTMRFHVPIITNPNVEFSVWNWNGEKITHNPKVGDMFMLDTRKPHTVINNGNEQRIHLVIDVFCNSYVRDLICHSKEIV